MQRQRQLLSDGLWVVGGRVGGAVLSLVLSVLLARLLSAAELGTYFAIVSLVAPVVTVGQLGLGPVAVRGVVLALETAQPATARGIVRATLRYGTLGAAGVGLALALGGQLLGQPLPLRLLLVAWAGLQIQQILLTELLRGFKDFRAATLLSGIGGDLVTTGLLLTLWLRTGALVLDDVLPILLVGVTLSVVAALTAVRRHVRALPREPATQPALLTQAWPLLVNNVGWLIFGQIDVWILAAFRPPAEVAIYGIARRLAVVLLQPQTVSRLVLAPRLVALHAQGRRAELEAVVRDASTLAGGLAILGGAAYLFGGAWLLGTFFGPAYRGGSAVLLVLALGQVVNACTGLAATTLIMTGHSRLVMQASLACGTLTAAGALWLTPRFGALGTAAMVSAGMIVQNVVLSLLTRHHVGIWTFINLMPREYGKLWKSPS